MVHSNVVPEELRNPAFEAVELRPRVLADRDERVHAQVRVIDDLGKGAGERLVAVLVGGIEEVVLELVEYNEQRPHACRPLTQRWDDGLARLPRRQLAPAERFDGSGVNLSHEL